MPQLSLVLELQQLAQSSQTDLSELLRRTEVVAAKLRLIDLEAWVENELNGYAPMVNVPSYRSVGTELVMKNPYRGNLPVMWTSNGALPDHFSKMDVRQPIASILHFTGAGDGQIEASVSPSELEVLLKVSSDFGLMPAIRIVNKSGMIGILDGVRNKILHWSLELESKGILGEGMTFTQAEKQAASTLTVHNYGPVIHGDNASIASATNSQGAIVTAASGSAGVHQRLTNSITQITEQNPELGDNIKRFVDAIATSQHLAAAQRAEANEHLAFIAEQCALSPDKRQPPTVLKSIFSSLRGMLGLAADVLQVWPTVVPPICLALGIAAQT